MITEEQLDSTFGHDRELWNRAKDEARQLLARTAKRAGLIEYGELAKEIRTITFDPHGNDFRHFLGQLSSEADFAGEAMITALVVHKHDQRPGNGFFVLAKRLGRNVSDLEECWTHEVARVFQQFAR